MNADLEAHRRDGTHLRGLESLFLILGTFLGVCAFVFSLKFYFGTHRCHEYAIKENRVVIFDLKYGCMEHTDTGWVTPELFGGKR